MLSSIKGKDDFFKKGVVLIKKYILPVAIILVSIFFLNNKIQPKDEGIAAKKNPRLPVLEIASRYGQAKPILLAKEIIHPNALRKEDIAEAAGKAYALEVDPYTEANVVFFNTPNFLEITEWDGEYQVESTKHPNTAFQASGQPGEKLFIIRAEWKDAGPATYVAKVQIKKISSLQYHFSEDRDKYTVIKFLPSEDEEWKSGPKDDPMYETKILGGEIPKLQSTFPELNISKLPSYFVFHRGVKLLATENEKELDAFLTKTTELTHTGEGENWKAEFITKHKLGEGTAELAIQFRGAEKPLPKEISFSCTGKRMDHGPNHRGIGSGWPGTCLL